MHVLDSLEVHCGDEFVVFSRYTCIRVQIALDQYLGHWSGHLISKKVFHMFTDLWKYKPNIVFSFFYRYFLEAALVEEEKL